MQSKQPLTNVQNKTRLQHIDIAKGIGILLVVFGHSSIFWVDEKGEIFNIIFSFHLPLFLFLSGLFFKANVQLKGLILNKLDSLIKPYFAILIPMTLNILLKKNHSILNYLSTIIYSSYTIPQPWGPLWFLTYLFAISLFSWLLVKVTRLHSIKRIYQILIMIVLLTVGVYISRVFWQIPISIYVFSIELPGLPFSIDIVLLGAFFFLLGFLLKQEVINFKIQAKYLILFLSLFCLCHYYFDYTINLHHREYDNLIISTLEALCGIYIVLCISSFLSKYQTITKIFAYIGSGSLFILIFHFIFQSQTAIFFARHYDTNYLTEFCAFIIGSTIPLLIWELVKRNHYLSLFFLPLKSNKITAAQKIFKNN
jgi:fucose 4-O-acetylase-like acetyltransferase